MLIVTAVNITGNGGQDENGLAHYEVEVAINHAPPIWKGTVWYHVRKAGAAQLLRLIADNMDARPKHSWLELKPSDPEIGCPEESH